MAKLLVLLIFINESNARGWHPYPSKNASFGGAIVLIIIGIYGFCWFKFISYLFHKLNQKRAFRNSVILGVLYMWFCALTLFGGLFIIGTIFALLRKIVLMF